MHITNMSKITHKYDSHNQKKDEYEQRNFFSY